MCVCDYHLCVYTYNNNSGGNNRKKLTLYKTTFWIKYIYTTSNSSWPKWTENCSRNQEHKKLVRLSEKVKIQTVSFWAKTGNLLVILAQIWMLYFLDMIPGKSLHSSFCFFFIYYFFLLLLLSVLVKKLKNFCLYTDPIFSLPPPYRIYVWLKIIYSSLLQVLHTNINTFYLEHNVLNKKLVFIRIYGTYKIF